MIAKYVPPIRGHGIPEAMESILHKSSKISSRVLIFKPISVAIVIGTGGPFGTEGPIIATGKIFLILLIKRKLGAALGSVLSQLFYTTQRERKIMVCVGASVGMSAIFSTPLSAILISIELLLNEYDPLSLTCVSIGTFVAVSKN